MVLRVSVLIVFCASFNSLGSAPINLRKAIIISQRKHIAHTIQQHPCFTQLPLAMQDIQNLSPQHMDNVGIVEVLNGLQEDKRPVHLNTIVWRMVLHQGVSHKTADHILANLDRLFANKPMRDNVGICWPTERENKVSLIKRLNCSKASAFSELDLNNEYSLCLQEFVYGIKNPYTRLTFENPVMPRDLVEYAAHYAGCRNVKAFDILRPGLEHFAHHNHQNCGE